MGDGVLVDSMIKDGLWDPYNDFHMGSCAEMCASKYAFTREEQDAYALESYRRAQDAARSGLAAEEIVPVDVPQKKGPAVRVDADEEPFAAPLDKVRALKPAFQKDGSVTAANSSKINDGAAALVVSSAEWASRRGAKPLARIVAYGGVAQAPEWFTTAPGGAIGRLLEKTGLRVSDVDLFEINEAFAAVALAAIRDLDLDPATVNVRGGAVALGHPIGASGGRVLVTLLYEMQKRNAKKALATLCIGGGMGIAMCVER
jgi:acetyl-CoA C-acetyltransferase